MYWSISSGEVVGIVMQDYSSGDENTLTAISVSQLKDIIEKLSNGQDIPYLGLKLTSVTSDIEKEYDIPKGVYIKSVGIDSRRWRQACKAVMSS